MLFGTLSYFIRNRIGFNISNGVLPGTYFGTIQYTHIAYAHDDKIIEALDYSSNNIPSPVRFLQDITGEIELSNHIKTPSLNSKQQK